MELKVVKLKNRRVALGRNPIDETLYFEFRRLINDEFFHRIYSETKIEGKVATKSFSLSKSAAVALFFLLEKELTVSDLTSFEKDSGQKVFKQ